MANSQKIKQNWIKQENFDVCFSPSFYRYYQKLTPRRETEH